MRTVLFIGAAVCAVSAITAADENDLSGGVLICHHDPAIIPCPPFEGWCEEYLDYYAISSCEEQNPSIMTEELRAWYDYCSCINNPNKTIQKGEGYEKNIYNYVDYGGFSSNLTNERPSNTREHDRRW